MLYTAEGKAARPDPKTFLNDSIIGSSQLKNYPMLTCRWESLISSNEACLVVGITFGFHSVNGIMLLGLSGANISPILSQKSGFGSGISSPHGTITPGGASEKDAVAASITFYRRSMPQPRRRVSQT